MMAVFNDLTTQSNRQQMDPTPQPGPWRACFGPVRPQKAHGPNEKIDRPGREGGAETNEVAGGLIPLPTMKRRDPQAEKSLSLTVKTPPDRKAPMHHGR